MNSLDLLKQKLAQGDQPNQTVDTIICQLKDWHDAFNIEVCAVEGSRVLVKFSQLPEKLDTLANEIYQICPDVIDQHFGCMDEMVAMLEHSEQELDPEIQSLIKGVDFDDEDFAMQLLIKSLASKQQVSLWWD
jgi:hypothetical protein